jgi:glycosyltransferase involved in cell wall biosynthesis
MRVLFVGNPGNTGYRFVRWLRESGVDAVLAIPWKNKGERNLPEWENGQSQDAYPEWMVKFRDSLLKYICPGNQLKRLAKKYDLILTAGEHIIPVLTLNQPVGILPVGGDMTRLPFGSKTFKQEIHSWFFRKRISKVKCIITEQEDIIWAARLLGQGNKIRRFPFLVDLYQLRDNVNHRLANELKKKYKDWDGLIFHPTRKNLDPNRIDYKGNEKLLHAYKRFIQFHPHKKILLISGLHGRHTSQYGEMVNEFGLEKHVEFIDHLSLPDLHAYMCLDHLAVFDQFTQNLNTLGGIQREALAFGKPVVSSTNVSTKEFSQAYGTGCPLFPAFNEEEIYQSMVELFTGSSEDWQNIGHVSVKWAENFLHWKSRMDEFINILEIMLKS